MDHPSHRHGRGELEAWRRRWTTVAAVTVSGALTSLRPVRPSPDHPAPHGCGGASARARRIRSAIAAVLAAIGVIALTASPAAAARAHAAPLPGPSTFATGFVDNDAFQFTSQAGRSLWLGRARALGSSYVRIDVDWSSVAPATPSAGFVASNPASPGYDWANLDATIETAVADRQTVVLMLYDAPLWAQGADAPSWAPQGSWEPNAADYGAFAHAVAERYSGHFPNPLAAGETLPRVSDFQAWNEPNLIQYLTPQWVTGPHHSIVAASPGIYRQLLNALYGGVTSVQPGSYVLAAGTAPYGDPPGVDRMRPLTFLEGLLCLSASLQRLSCPDPAHFDALDHHPYALNPTLHARVAGDISVPDLGEIFTALKAAERLKTALPAGPKALWDTEIDWSTETDVASPISPALQARYLSQAFYELWAQGVDHVFWFDIVDPATPVFTSSTGTGVYFQSGAPKPSAVAFRFPFVALTKPSSARIIWGRAPTAGSVAIQHSVGGGWRTVLRIRTTAGGVFYQRATLPAGWLLRATLGGVTSLPWSAS